MTGYLTPAPTYLTHAPTYSINSTSYSTQAITYLVLIIITSFINLICYSLISGVWGFVGYLLYTLITVPFVILWIYNIDCL